MSYQLPQKQEEDIIHAFDYKNTPEFMVNCSAVLSVFLLTVYITMGRYKSRQLMVSAQKLSVDGEDLKQVVRDIVEEVHEYKQAGMKHPLDFEVRWMLKKIVHIADCMKLAALQKVELQPSTEMALKTWLELLTPQIWHERAQRVYEQYEKIKSGEVQDVPVCKCCNQ